MTRVTLKKACELTGKSKRTIQRYMSTGKVSYMTNIQGHKQIDVSELLRVFGELSPPVTDEVRPAVTMTNNTVDISPQMAEMIAAEVSKGVSQAIAPLIAKIENLTNRLEYKPQPAEEVKQDKPPAEKVRSEHAISIEKVNTGKLKEKDYFSGLSFLGEK
jgi:hypothetical protein